METTIVYWGYVGDNGKENVSYYNVLGLMPEGLEARVFEFSMDSLW